MGKVVILLMISWLFAMLAERNLGKERMSSCTGGTAFCSHKCGNKQMLFDNQMENSYHYEPPFWLLLEGLKGRYFAT
ncbi:hypothetical protein MA16_Dca021217 [Dendrobium catenatum]|uniref:Uncharacterized protein n=1 Tax=Dendrobium catenatum TaxID=906689 RepID=A0A2I0WE24_9ASPA|nr:hypothetical protein MA16_Dca021217 [Dendrobium catenatum]